MCCTIIFIVCEFSISLLAFFITLNSFRSFAGKQWTAWLFVCVPMLYVPSWIKRIYQRSPMQTEKSQPEGERIMSETRFTEFLALSVYPRAGVSVCIRDGCLIIFLTYGIKKFQNHSLFLLFMTVYVT